MSRWVYLSDLAPKGTVMNLETGELRSIMSSAVKDRAPAGLRRYVLEELAGGMFRETGEVLPITPELADDMEECYRAPNGWNYDWPHLQIEQEGDLDAERRERIVNKLTQSMSAYPYEFRVTGLQRRYLMYYSDGSYSSQQRFERLVPNPDSFPFRRNGELRRKYSFIWNSIMRDANVPFPHEQQNLYGSLRPLLYMGPAWVVRFTVDNHDVLLERCRVYVDDDANFICSDWCQRHDFSSYNNGINLQQGIYTFDTWVTGPCLIRNAEQGWSPPSATIKRTAVRELMRRAPAAVPTFDAALAKATAAVNQYAKTHTLTPAVDAGPITADAMAEAMEKVAEILAARAEAAPVVEEVAPPPVRKSAEPSWTSAFAVPQCEVDEDEVDHSEYDAEPELNENWGYRVEYRLENANDPTVVMARRRYTGPAYRDDNLTAPESELEVFKISDTSPTGFFYESSEDGEYLHKHWWLYSAAVYYRDNVMSSAAQQQLTKVLLEA